MNRTATLSDCGAYRYDLTRRWAPGPTALFVMLNPSTADADLDDPTIRRCVSFADREGCGKLAVVNLYALRSSKPAALLEHPDPVGPRNAATIRRWLAGPGTQLVVAAWGAFCTSPAARRSGVARLHVEQLAADAGRNLLCLGHTKAGAPRHPLYVRGDQPLEQLEVPA